MHSEYGINTTGMSHVTWDGGGGGGGGVSTSAPLS